MDEKKIIEIAEEAGFVKAAVMSTGDLVFVHEFRTFCEQNACGNYGNNYGCPPYCGTPKEMENKVMEYRRAIVFQSRTSVEDIFDDSETKKLKKMHTNMTLRAMENLKNAGLQMDGFPVMCGPCNYCNTCRIQEQKPCNHEKMCFSCLSAYCVDAAQMAKYCEMEMQWNGDVVSFFSLYVFDRKDKGLKER